MLPSKRAQTSKPSTNGRCQVYVNNGLRLIGVSL